MGALGGPRTGAGGWSRLDGRGKLGYMSDSGTAVSVPAAVAADSADPACDVAHGKAPLPASTRTLVAVFTSPVARFLLGYARDAGYRPVLFDPDAGQLAGHDEADGHGGVSPDVLDALLGLDGLTTVTTLAGLADKATDVVVTDHHRPELGIQLRDALAAGARWVGIMGNPRHVGPHVAALTELGVPAHEISKVHRPIGVNIGSRTPAEIAIATIAGLIADRNGKPGGFTF